MYEYQTAALFCSAPSSSLCAVLVVSFRLSRMGRKRLDIWTDERIVWVKVMPIRDGVVLGYS